MDFMFNIILLILMMIGALLSGIALGLSIANKAVKKNISNTNTKRRQLEEKDDYTDGNEPWSRPADWWRR